MHGIIDKQCDIKTLLENNLKVGDIKGSVSWLYRGNETSLKFFENGICNEINNNKFSNVSYVRQKIYLIKICIL